MTVSWTLTSSTTRKPRVLSIASPTESRGCSPSPSEILPGNRMGFSESHGL
ncbi:hypothetical protein [Enterobacter phage 01_vB_Eclo_IJM]|nr:hypothetical protein [Enterobacter phage 01_vB_Eclo_IJM]